MEPIKSDLIAALARLALEAQHILDTKRGEKFLQMAIDNANEVMARALEKK